MRLVLLPGAYPSSLVVATTAGPLVKQIYLSVGGIESCVCIRFLSGSGEACVGSESSSPFPCGSYTRRRSSSIISDTLSVRTGECPRRSSLCRQRVEWKRMEAYIDRHVEEREIVAGGELTQSDVHGRTCVCNSHFASIGVDCILASIIRFSVLYQLRCCLAGYLLECHPHSSRRYY
ncbi:hypothetical protein BDY19DRAFT_708624 [Irpex rosettiformis]|uniref:Uncharacterized protein n=1 Tax=Irpex rosettiformis TaxID=378272 RepID=A0ACB8TMR1_9APHY|nr:hypothetical protein BDY19DRAFT_708624 [Irpex rosettiformis]